VEHAALAEARAQLQARDQILFFIRLDLHRKPPDSGERQYKSRN